MSIANALTALREAYAARRRIWNIATAWLASVTLLRFPDLIAWIPEEQRADIFTTADFIQRYAVGIALLWAKDATVSGNGSDAKPVAKNIHGQNTPL